MCRSDVIGGFVDGLHRRRVTTAIGMVALGELTPRDANVVGRCIRSEAEYAERVGHAVESRSSP